MNDLISALPRTENRARILLEIALVLATLALAISGFLYAGVRVVAGPVSVLLAVMMIWLLLRWRGRTWSAVGLEQPPKLLRTVFFGLVTWLLVTFVMGGLQPLLVWLIGRPVNLSALDFVRGNTTAFLMMLLMAWSTAAVGEELIFRGFVMNRLSEFQGEGRLAWVSALLLQGALFGLAHFYQGLAGMVFTGVLGCLLGLAYLATGWNLWVPIIAHGLIDTVSLLALYLNLDKRITSGG